MGTTGGGEVLSASTAEAGELLGAVQRVSKEARRARHGYWFPLLLSGLIILGDLPFNYYRVGYYGGGFRGFPWFCLCSSTATHAWGSTIYWLIAMPLGYAAVARYYVIRARRTGLRVKIWPYVVTGVAVFALLILTSTPLPRSLRFMWRIESWRAYAHFDQGFTPVLVISLALFVLAKLERSKVLFLIALANFAVAILANTYNMSNEFLRLPLVPDVQDWAANLSFAGGVLVFVGLVSFIVLSLRGRRHDSSR